MAKKKNVIVLTSPSFGVPYHGVTELQDGKRLHILFRPEMETLKFDICNADDYRIEDFNGEKIYLGDASEEISFYWAEFSHVRYFKKAVVKFQNRYYHLRLKNEDPGADVAERLLDMCKPGASDGKTADDYFKEASSLMNQLKAMWP